MSKQLLDEKLLEILDKARTEQKPDARELVPEIKQAFADEGYIPYKPYGDIPADQKPPDWWSKTPTIMTGQEWYDRFFKELQAGNSANIVAYANLGILEAAKRAAGLREPS